MKALIFKDLFLLKRKKMIISVIINILLTIPIGLMFKNVYAVALMTCLSYPVGASTFLGEIMEVDEKTDFDKIAISLPLTKNEIVMSKWISSSVFLLIHVVIGAIFGIVHNSIYQYTSLQNIMLIVFIGFLVGILLLSINNVGFFLFGSKKGTYVYIIVLILSVVGYILIYFGIDYTSLLTLSVPLLLVLGVLITFLICAMNYFITLKIFIKRYS